MVSLEIKIAVLKENLRDGVSPAMVTPLHEDGYQVNTAVLPDLVNFLIEKGVKGLFVGGTTGEGILLDVGERKKLHEATMVAVNGRVPVLLHVGANQTRTAVNLTRHAVEIDADAIVALPPTFFGLGEKSLVDYYQAIAAAAPATPLLPYDIPHMAINGISPQLLIRLSQQITNLAGMKTSRLDAQIIRQLLDAAPPHLVMLAGNERIALGSLAMGADGLISGLSTAVPEPFIAMTRAFAAGDVSLARQEHQRINRLLELLPAQGRIGAIKIILAERGIPVGPAVPPQPMPGSPLWPQMEQLLQGT